jgi:phosphatidylinositol alpha-1,6-mannosyltransferase
MPRALLFTTDFAPSKGGGICTHSTFMVEALKKYDWEFTVLCDYYIPTTDESIRQYSKQSDTPIYRTPPAPNKLSLIKKVIHCLKVCHKVQPDLILGTGRHPTWFAALVAFIMRKPLVTIGHGTEFSQSTSKYDFRINKWAYSKSNLIIAISKFTKQIVEEAGIKPKNTIVINNPADESFFKILDQRIIDDFKAEKKLLNKKIILTVGSLSERKGQRVVIKSLPEIVKHHQDILYVAIGTPTLSEEFLRLSEALGVSEHVFFPGIIDEKELLLWLNACDLFVMASVNHNGDYEGYGIAVVEAALCGKTSVVSDNGGLKEAVIHQKTGIIVPENDIQMSGKAIIDLLNNPALIMKLSQNAYAFAQENNTQNEIGLKYNIQLKTVLTN